MTPSQLTVCSAVVAFKSREIAADSALRARLRSLANTSVTRELDAEVEALARVLEVASGASDRKEPFTPTVVHPHAEHTGLDEVASALGHVEDALQSMICSERARVREAAHKPLAHRGRLLVITDDDVYLGRVRSLGEIHGLAVRGLSGRGQPAAFGRRYEVGAVIVRVKDPLTLAELLPLDSADAVDNPPVIVMTECPDLDFRLKAAQAGASLVLSSSTSPEAVICLVAQLTRLGHTYESRVLALLSPETPALLSLHALECPEFRVTALSDPKQLLGALEVLEPDALIIDGEDEHAGANALCRVLRAHLRWRELFVLCVTSGGSRAREQAFRAGFDGCIPPDIEHRELSALLCATLARRRPFVT